MRGKEGGRGDVVTKAVAAGLLGLQLLGMPIALVARQAAVAGVTLPRLELVTAGAKVAVDKPPLTIEEEMIGEMKLWGSMEKSFSFTIDVVSTRIVCFCVNTSPFRRDCQQQHYCITKFLLRECIFSDSTKYEACWFR